MNEEKTYQKKCIKAAVISVGICYLFGNWLATQIVAADCDYNKLLGEYLQLGDMCIYAPYKYYIWSQDALLQEAIPQILSKSHKYLTFSIAIGLLYAYLYSRTIKQYTTHGSARFANADEIEATGLGEHTIVTKKVHVWKGISFKRKIKEPRQSGVVIGINPYTHRLMLHDGPEHILLMAPTRSGKGVNTIIPTGLIWKASIFFFDVKGELWQATAGFRQKVLGQKVIKFEPLCTDGSAARWNPLAEINFMTTEELSDTASIVGIMVRPNGEKQGGGDPFWDNAATALINGVILHLLYSHYREGKPLPCPTDIMSYLSSPDKTTDELFEDMKNYAHITPQEFLEMEYTDLDGKVKKYKNPLKEIYGEYIKNFKVFSEALKKTVRSIDDIRQAILESDDPIDFEIVDEEIIPFHLLLTHPKVAECANNMLQGAEQTRASIMQTAQTALAIYQDPVVQKNTAVSDFYVRDLLDPKREVSVYLVMQFKDMETLKPLSRLFINTILDKLIRDMKFDKDQSTSSMKKQRLLLMLDEFPQLGNLKAMERALAVCAGYGIKVCIVSQDVNQLNKEYTKDNSLASNCHVHVYFTPNLDSGSATAAAISKNLGKQTIVTVSHSDGGGLFKGSNSKSFTSRDLMTPDEVSHMSSERELVFVAGHKTIYGIKLRYYLQPFFLKRMLPTPMYSDTATNVFDYAGLFRVHAAESADKEIRKRAVAEAKEREMILKENDVKRMVYVNEKTTDSKPIESINSASKEHGGTEQDLKIEQYEFSDKRADPGEAKQIPERAWSEGKDEIDQSNLKEDDKDEVILQVIFDEK